MRVPYAVFALTAWLATACYSTSGDDEGAPAASAIPKAAYSAVGADYPPPGASGMIGGTGLKACDDYFRKIDRCKAVPPSARKALQDAAKQMRQSISQAKTPEAKRSLEEACEQASKALTMCDTHL